MQILECACMYLCVLIVWISTLQNVNIEILQNFYILDRQTYWKIRKQEEAVIKKILAILSTDQENT